MLYRDDSSALIRIPSKAERHNTKISTTTPAYILETYRRRKEMLSRAGNVHYHSLLNDSASGSQARNQGSLQPPAIQRRTSSTPKHTMLTLSVTDTPMKWSFLLPVNHIHAVCRQTPNKPPARRAVALAPSRATFFLPGDHSGS